MKKVVIVEDKCNRCGLCCFLADNKPCRFLEQHEDGTTSCKVYGTRKGRYLGDGYYCTDIMEVVQLYPGCPYNEDKLRAALGEIKNK